MLYWYSVSFWGGKPDWEFFKVIAENEQQIIDLLDRGWPDRKNCLFDREGNPSTEPKDWTEVQLLGKVPVPMIIGKV